ncbi:hypothetical protein Q9233_009215 [Columba guinea]|nr:hypothetical protein Q9233_009215 [Columba guinea]
MSVSTVPSRELLRGVLPCGGGERAVLGGTFGEQRYSEDGGSLALWSSVVLWLQVLDVNDNAPVFAKALQRPCAREQRGGRTGAEGAGVGHGLGQNARVRYRLGEGRVRGAPLSSSVSVEAETGALYALRSFDYEEVREVGLWVRAEDGGAPALSSNLSVRLVIVDENHNAPQVLYLLPVPVMLVRERGQQPRSDTASPASRWFLHLGYAPERRTKQ